MDWTIILCFVFANVILSRGDGLRRRFSVSDFASPVSRDYFSFGDEKKHSTHYRKSDDLPNILRNYLERRLTKAADKRRSTLLENSEEVKERVLPPSEPARPGHTLLQPTRTMLKSAAKYPRSDGVSLVYGSQDNLGIAHGQTPYRVVYSDFRKDNLAKLLTNIFKGPDSVGSLRRSSNSRKKFREMESHSKRKLRVKKKTLKGKNKDKNKKGGKFKKLDSKRAHIYHSDFDSSKEIENIERYGGSRAKTKSLKRKKKNEYLDSNTSDYSKETKTRALPTPEKFRSYKKQTHLNKKKRKDITHENNVKLHHKLGEKLQEKLDQKLKMSKLKKQVPLDTYKKKMFKTPKKKPPLVRHSGSSESSSMESSIREATPKHSNSKSNREDNYERENKMKDYKENKRMSKNNIKRSKKTLKRSKQKRIFRQNDDLNFESDKESLELPIQENEYSDSVESGEKKLKKKKKKKEESKDKTNSGRLVYGSPDNYGIVWGKTPYRTMYTDFRRTTSLLGKILEAYHSYKREKNLKKALVAIKVWPLEKTKMNSDNSDEVYDQVLASNSNEILDDASIDIDIKVADFRKQRRKSSYKVKSAFRNRDDSYDKGNSSNCDGSDESEDSDDSDYEKNPGNPYTLFKNKYRQNWPWHFELGDHINLNPFGPEFNQGGPSGADLFFNRKWWYFNQDDFIPFR